MCIPHPGIATMRIVTFQTHSAEHQASLFARVIPSSYPQLENYKYSKNKRASCLYFPRVYPPPLRAWKVERLFACRKCRSYEMNAGIFRHDLCPWQLGALQTTPHLTVGHSECHQPTKQVWSCHSPCSIAIHQGVCLWFLPFKFVQFDSWIPILIVDFLLHPVFCNLHCRWLMCAGCRHFYTGEVFLLVNCNHL